jgi:nitrogen regulatory protein P-II 1
VIVVVTIFCFGALARAGDLHFTIDVLVRKSRTGTVGDGKVFVMDVEEAVRVRTGDSGIKAI